MNKGIVLILFTVFAAGLAQARMFTDAKGRQIEAELVAHAGGKVVISRAGQKFTVPVSMFSATDQAYIKAWIEENPDKIDMDYKFRFFANCDTQRSTRQKDGAMITDKIKFNDNEYEFIIYNSGDTEVINITVKYEIHIADFVVMKGNRYTRLAVGYDKSESLEVIAGVKEVKSIPVKGRFDFERTFSTEFYIDRDGGVTDQAAQDKVIGAIIRIYKGEELLAEHVDTQDDKRGPLMKWQDKKPGEQER